MNPLEADEQELDVALRVARASIGKDASVAWQVVATLGPTDPAICIELVERLREQGLHTQADEALHQAIGRLPSSMELPIIYARSAANLGDPEEENRRWALVRTRFPDQVHGYLGGSRALRRRHRQIEAELILKEGINKFGHDRRLLTDLAASVTSRSDWAAARQWWSEVERLGWLDDQGYSGLGIAHLRGGDVEAAEETLKQGLVSHANSPEILMGYAELLTAREDWQGAIHVWQDLVRRFPGNERFANGLGVAKWRLSTYQDDRSDKKRQDTHLERPVDVGLVEDTSIRELLEAFESLGQDCEFGLVQRHFGAEPLGLLRWTTTKPDTLISALRTRFVGLGEVENTVLDLGKPEIMVNDLALRIRFHTFIQQGVSLDLDKFRHKQARHLRFMRETFLERLECGERIYVYKFVGDFDQDKMEILFEELNRIGSASLVVVTRAVSDQKGATMETLRDGLYLGRLSRYGLDEGSAWNIAFDEWTTICRQVLSAIKTQV